ncbi:WbqC family protein [Myroides sp. DF42-4-2]|uniref:WbqC family protein n=1 Tax=unclassified Myroides TaxID=2642485 RepID=UPI00257672A9|nr:WbqC family protein [Myroides sp. DF42-4-2]MDM1408119.1 WbqC family protein [Myroides sp. DF42-4-2]
MTNTILLHPTYFPSISHYVAMAQAEALVFEVEDSFQKQTNRNRMYIHNANGMQMLNIPIKHTKVGPGQKFKDVQIEYAFGWQKQHFKSLEAAYRTSPYFEYFEDDIRPVFEKDYKYMLDLNLEIHDIITSCLGVTWIYDKTEEYFKEVPAGITDFRDLANGKKDENQFEPYVQVFDDKNGFLNNLSILDLLFNEGRNAVDYLKNQQLR